MTDAERLIERLLDHSGKLLPMTYEEGPDYGMLVGPSFQAMTMDPGALQETLEAIPSLATLIQQQAARIVELEGALRGVIDTADSFCDCSGDEVAAQVKIRARAVLGETSSAK